MIFHKSFDENNLVNDLEKEHIIEHGIGRPKDVSSGSKVHRLLKTIIKKVDSHEAKQSNNKKIKANRKSIIKIFENEN